MGVGEVFPLKDLLGDGLQLLPWAVDAGAARLTVTSLGLC